MNIEMRPWYRFRTMLALTMCKFNKKNTVTRYDVSNSFRSSRGELYYLIASQLRTASYKWLSLMLNWLKVTFQKWEISDQRGPCVPGEWTSLLLMVFCKSHLCFIKVGNIIEYWVAHVRVTDRAPTNSSNLFDSYLFHTCSTNRTWPFNCSIYSNFF